VDKNTFVILIY